MKEILSFDDRLAFEEWLKVHGESGKGVDIFIYKKKYKDLGLTYEDAVETALCYGWIDAVTHRYNEEKFVQYFAPRRSTGNWSLSNIIRVKQLIDSGRMTKAGLTYFDMSLLERIDDLIRLDKEAKRIPPTIPKFIEDKLISTNALKLFKAQTISTQRRYIAYIEDGKKESTRINRCEKIIKTLLS